MLLAIDSKKRKWNDLQNDLKKSRKAFILSSMKASKLPQKAKVPPTRVKKLNNPNLKPAKIPTPSPLPDIPADNYPDNSYYRPRQNLDEWDVLDSASPTKPAITNNYDSMLKRYNINRGSPPLYVKERKPYVVVSSLRRKNTASSAISDQNTFEYIRIKPYKGINPSKSQTISYNFDHTNDEYAFFKTNKKFSDQYVDDFITKTLNDELIPDLLIDIIDNIKKENLKQSMVRTDDRLKFVEPSVNIHTANRSKTQSVNDLFSTQFIEELGYKANIPTPTSRLNRSTSEDGLMDIYLKETNKHIQPDLVKKQNDKEARLDYENFIIEQIIYEQIINPLTAETCTSIFNSIMHQYSQDIDAVQKRNIRMISNEKLLNSFELDILLNKLAMHGRTVVDNDDLNRLMDSMMIDILLNVQSDVRKCKNKTLKNYPLKKFYLNTFMNVTLDILTSELALSLNQDMINLHENERKALVQA